MDKIVEGFLCDLNEMDEATRLIFTSAIDVIESNLKEHNYPKLPETRRKYAVFVVSCMVYSDKEYDRLNAWLERFRPVVEFPY